MKRHGALITPLRQYGERFGFDDYWTTGRRIQIRRNTKGEAQKALDDLTVLVANGRKDLASADIIEWAQFRAWKQTHQSSPTVDDCVAEFIAAKTEEHEIGRKWLEKLGDYLEIFRAAFGHRQLIQVREPEIDEWLRGLRLTPRTRNNQRAPVVQLYRWARSKRYLPDETTEAERVRKFKIKKAQEITLWSADEMRRRMDACPFEHIPLTAINAFSGVRSEELKPEYGDKPALAWEDFDWPAKMIRMTRETSKVNEARDIPISDQLAAWLAPFRHRRGPCVTSELSVARVSQWIADVSGVPHKRNANRHSFISYWMAINRDLARIADECGTSVYMIKTNYRRPAPVAEAEKYLGIMPQEGGNMIHFPESQVSHNF